MNQVRAPTTTTKTVTTLTPSKQKKEMQNMRQINANKSTGDYIC